MKEADINYDIVFVSFLMPIILALILIWFIVNYQKKKNQYEIEQKEQKLIAQQLVIDRHEALQAERNRIAAEMHDDLGGGLTSIKFISQKVLRKIEDQETNHQVARILEQSEILVNNMSEIIWAMSAGFDTLKSLISYTRRFASEYLDDHEINLEFSIKGKMNGYELSGEKRRNIFLVIKEAIHNVVKHADGDLIKILFEIQHQMLSIEIADNGSIKKLPQSNLGHGLKNMTERISAMQGNISFAIQDGFLIRITIPLEVPTTHVAN